MTNPEKESLMGDEKNMGECKDLIAVSNEEILVDKESKHHRVRIVGALNKCPECNVNYSALGTCVMCDLRLEREKELGRRMTQKEWDELFAWLK